MNINIFVLSTCYINFLFKIINTHLIYLIFYFSKYMCTFLYDNIKSNVIKYDDEIYFMMIICIKKIFYYQLS